MIDLDKTPKEYKEWMVKSYSDEMCQFLAYIQEQVIKDGGVNYEKVVMGSILHYLNNMCTSEEAGKLLYSSFFMHVHASINQSLSGGWE